ncbi:hypothetical protein MIND_00561600 [Mycena indigotica]|uniref:Uncharacterized protein n=1 Tax=Mycena indigotica TaxID=2126181 RepID=A0A8H6W8N8_9AGAR|nr:uncharacterized protein MIND_00561600 [Mycena indigotica]KAF7303339.1 hypothetical protein MIND_00561600 [Mycena indigotica]
MRGGEAEGVSYSALHCLVASIRVSPPLTGHGSSNPGHNGAHFPKTTLSTFDNEFTVANPTRTTTTSSHRDSCSRNIQRDVDQLVLMDAVEHNMPKADAQALQDRLVFPQGPVYDFATEMAAPPLLAQPKPSPSPTKSAGPSGHTD